MFLVFFFVFAIITKTYNFLLFFLIVSFASTTSYAAIILPPPPKPSSIVQNTSSDKPYHQGIPLSLVSKPFRPCIIIDAGHGGKDPGSISIRRRYEKHVCLIAAKVIAEALITTGRYNVKLTRKHDSFVPLRQRFRVARESHADFFISIHADSHPSQEVRGMTIYTLSNIASDKEALRLSKQENKFSYYENISLDETIDGDVIDIITDIARRGSSTTALMLAEELHADLKKNKTFHVRKLRSAGLTVLKAPEVPSILIELGYLSNKHDERLVHSPEYHKDLANSLIRALDRYYDKT